MAANSALAFGALLGGAVVLEYGIRHSKAAFASSGSSTTGTSTASTTAGSTDLPDPSTAQGSVISQVDTVLSDAGFNKIAIAGILGNGYGESGLDPSATDGNGNGGLWGFTDSPNSLADLQAYATAHGADWTNPTVQAEFLTTVVSASDKATLNSQTSPSEAAAWFQDNWEHPASLTGSIAKREAAAESVYKQITGSSGGNG